jgi:hypothetical protein
MVIDDIHYTQHATNGDKKILGKCLEFFYSDLSDLLSSFFS